MTVSLLRVIRNNLREHPFFSRARAEKTGCSRRLDSKKTMELLLVLHLISWEKSIEGNVLAAPETFLNQLIRKDKVLFEEAVKLSTSESIIFTTVDQKALYQIHYTQRLYTAFLFNSFRYHEVQCSLQLRAEVSRAIVRIPRCGLVPSQTS